MHDLFKGYYFFINDGDKLIPPAIEKGDLIRILERAGGTVVKSLPKSTTNLIHLTIQNVELTQDQNKNDLPFVRKNGLISHKWVLDSISNHKPLDKKNYIVNY